MFKKILIANRGEIACRVIRTCRRLDIATVAVYSHADVDALHVRLADEAVAIGPAPAAESYLSIERIVEACKATGAEAVHPGFGFLSENPRFVEALDAAGIVFIGPPVKAIAVMGDKIESKSLAMQAGVSTIPGHLEALVDADEAVRVAERIGYPVMLKASAGGGGKGMRVARTAKEVEAALRGAQNEARSSFGDDRVFLEKFIERPRHIEIQVLADCHGGIVHLGERECSIQRRHQKVIEEAPSPFLDAATREAMGAQAVALARTVGYTSAGTVEFIADQNKDFYFLEMNTRIQVEHPVTEVVTGLDLVEWMIRIAAGEHLGMAQEELRMDGWAVEARVYAEDPRRNFLPSIGRLVRYREPSEGSDGSGGLCRIDSGVVEGSEITMFYDPMIAKVIGSGASREDAIDTLRLGLDSFVIRGIDHNIEFLCAVLGHERFRNGDLSTDFIEEVYPQGFAGASVDPGEQAILVAMAAVLHSLHEWRLNARRGATSQQWTVIAGSLHFPALVENLDKKYRVTISNKMKILIEGDVSLAQHLLDCHVNGERVVVQAEPRGHAIRVSRGGVSLDCLVVTPETAELARNYMPDKESHDLSRYLLSPMPGLLVSLAVGAGQEVKAGEELAVVEAMKMENILRAERDGTVKTLHAAPGDSLAVDQAIIEFEEG